MSIYGRLRPTGLLFSSPIASSAPPYTDCTVASTAPGHQRLLQLKHSPTPCVFSVVEGKERLYGDSVRHVPSTHWHFFSVLCNLLTLYTLLSLSVFLSFESNVSFEAKTYNWQTLWERNIHTLGEKSKRDSSAVQLLYSHNNKETHFFASDTEDTGRRLMTAIWNCTTLLLLFFFTLILVFQWVFLSKYTVFMKKHPRISASNEWMNDFSQVLAVLMPTTFFCAKSIITNTFNLTWSYFSSTFRFVNIFYAKMFYRLMLKTLYISLTFSYQMFFIWHPSS